MRRLLSTLTILAVSASVFAQNTVHYWLDRQTERSVLSGSEINTAGLSTGMHFAHFQIAGSDGLLSPVKSKAFLVLNDQLTPSSDVSTVKLWFDRHTTKRDLTTGTTEVDCSSLATGLHLAHLQIVGNDGTVSPVHSKMFVVINEQLGPSSAYSAINYWFDRQTTMQAYTSGDIDCSNLSNGIHAVHFQLIDANGKPCPVRTQFFVNLNFSAHQIYYWFDDATTRNLMDVGDSELSVEGLANGKHTLHAMLADANGNVLSPEQMSADFVIVCPDDEHVDDNADGICDVCDELFCYTRATTEGRYGTVCLPKGATADNITGATFYSIAGKRVNGNDVPTSIVLEEVSDIVAGQPYIFLGSGANLHVIYSGEAVAEAGSKNGLVGSFEYMEVAEGLYLLSNNTFVKCGEGCSIAGNRAYIDMDEVPPYVEGSVAAAKMAVIGLDGATNVSGIRIEGGEAVRHNVSGIRIPQGTKGIVIMNGKKMLKK